MATVSDLKTAVEDVFKDHIQEDGGKISWSHVWGQFCLCHEGYKLVDDREYLKDFGIKDGDQLRFIRHLSVKKQPKNQEENVEQNVLRLTRPEEVSEVEEDTRVRKNEKHSPHSNRDKQYHNFQGVNQGDGEVAIVSRTEFKLARIFRRWLSFSKLGSPRKSEWTSIKPGKYF